jgi:hypothetical protein
MPTSGQQPVHNHLGPVAKAQPAPLWPAGADSFIRISGRFSKMPSWRTSPPRPLSASATRTVAFSAHPTDIGDSIHQARRPCMRLCASHPARRSTFCMSRSGPPITQRTSGLDCREVTAARDAMVESQRERQEVVEAHASIVGHRPRGRPVRHRRSGPVSPRDDRSSRSQPASSRGPAWMSRFALPTSWGR